MYTPLPVANVPVLPVSDMVGPTTVRVPTGEEEAVLTPTLPLLATMNFVPVELPTTKLGTFVPRAFGLTARSPQGVVVAMPTLPDLSILIRSPSLIPRS